MANIDRIRRRGEKTVNKIKNASGARKDKLQARAKRLKRREQRVTDRQSGYNMQGTGSKETSSPSTFSSSQQSKALRGFGDITGGLSDKVSSAVSNINLQSKKNELSKGIGDFAAMANKPSKPSAPAKPSNKPKPNDLFQKTADTFNRTGAARVSTSHTKGDTRVNFNFTRK